MWGASPLYVFMVCLAAHHRMSDLLLARNIFDALLVASASELCVEEFVKALTACLLADESAWEDDDVGIVVLADEMCNLWLPHKTCTYLLVLVESHRDAFT